MRKNMYLSLALLVLGMTSFGPAAAQVLTQTFVPESGFYWNRDQPGRGYAIEVQDRLVFMTVYTYTEEANPALREPLWFSVTGTLAASGEGNGGVTYQFTDELAFSEDGQCLGCSFVEPLTTATGRPVTLTFTGLITGELLIDNEVIPIERFWYSASIQDAYLAMLGQWTIVTDCTAPVNNNCYPSSPDVQPFEGDLLTLDRVLGSGGNQTADGFRAGTALEVAGAFDETQNVFVIVVAETGNESVAYVIFGEDFGTDRFSGIAERFTPGSNLTGDGFPMYGFRISDLSFAQTLSPGSKAAAGQQAVTQPRTAAPVRGKAKPGLEVADQRLQAINRTVRRLESRIKARRAN